LCVVATAIVLPGGQSPSRGQMPPPPRRHAEKLTFDEKTGQWVRAPEPVPGTEQGDLNIARQWLARDDCKTALKAINGWIKTYGTGSSCYAAALYVKASAELGLGDYRAAHDSYQKLLNDYPGSEYAEQALKGDFAVGEQYMAGKKRKAVWGLLRIKDREAGVKIMDDMVSNYSDTPLAELAQMSKADYFYSRGEFETAEQEYQTFATQFPISGWRERALLQSARSALASFPGVKYDDSGLLEAQERFHDFERSYPQAAEQHGVPVLLDDIAAKRAEKSYEIGRFYDKSRRFKSAAYYYRATIRDWPDTPSAGRAANRLVEIGEPCTVPAPSAPVVTPPAPAPTTMPSAVSSSAGPGENVRHGGRTLRNEELE
jgi:outer membrane assembly lipoprotein YfiO